MKGIVYGCLAPRLHEQFKGERDCEGFCVTRTRLRYLQRCADGVALLAVGQLITDGEKHKMLKRLTKRIEVTFYKPRRK